MGAEASGILFAFRTYGPKGALVMALGAALFAFIRARVQAGKEERQARHEAEARERAVADAERAKLITMLQNQTTQTLEILRNELKVTQDSHGRLFDILDRNTRGIEAMVQRQDTMNTAQGLLSQQLSRLEGSVSGMDRRSS